MSRRMKCAVGKSLVMCVLIIGVRMEWRKLRTSENCALVCRSVVMYSAALLFMYC